MEELSAVGEQVFDAECILNKRLRKVRAAARFGLFFGGFFFSFFNELSSSSSLGFCFTGEVGVSGEVEGVVIQVSASGAASARNNENNNSVPLVARSRTVSRTPLSIPPLFTVEWRTPTDNRGRFVSPRCFCFCFFKQIPPFFARFLLFVTSRFG